ncbi:MAG: hypothetical protein LBF75_10220 [Treponema sp.]|jgi:hypothetical protein|nr:hypothetical protein [Treponema sp.]
MEWNKGDTWLWSYAKYATRILHKVVRTSPHHLMRHCPKDSEKNQKRSVSKLVEEYLSSISSSADKKVEYNTLGPITKELVGIKAE